MAIMNEDLALQAASLYSSGLTFGRVAKELEISQGRVGGLVREGITIMQNNGPTPAVITRDQLDNERLKTPRDEDLDLSILDDEREYDFDGVLEKSFLVKATPILRKVALNPRIFFYFEYAKKKFGWAGDIGDFLVECVEDFWKNKGYSIRIVYDEELKL